jgi:hypothetical protein
MAGKYSIDIGGVSAGWVMSAEGGGATSDVVTEKIGPDVLRRHETIALTFGTGMSNMTGEAGGKAHSRREFTGALITELGIPALDAASKAPAHMTVKLLAEATHDVPSPRGVLPAAPPVQEPWDSSSFRLTIDGLDCSRVNKIEALTVKQKVVEHAVGEAAPVETPKLVVTLSSMTAESWDKWHKDFVIKGNDTDDKEPRSATLEYLAPDRSKVLGSVTFHGLGIFKVTPEKVESHGDKILSVTVEMYCEKITAKFA